MRWCVNIGGEKPQTYTCNSTDCFYQINRKIFLFNYDLKIFHYGEISLLVYLIPSYYVQEMAAKKKNGQKY